MNTDTCQLMQALYEESGKFQCIISVTPAGEAQVKAEVGFCEPGPACGNL